MAKFENRMISQEGLKHGDGVGEWDGIEGLMKTIGLLD